jgi:hypothetical protein
VHRLLLLEMEEGQELLLHRLFLGPEPSPRRMTQQPQQQQWPVMCHRPSQVATGSEPPWAGLAPRCPPCPRTRDQLPLPTPMRIRYSTDLPVDTWLSPPQASPLVACRPAAWISGKNLNGTPAGQSGLPGSSRHARWNSYLMELAVFSVQKRAEK